MEQLLNGRFEYEVPHLLLSETEVALTLDEGQNFRGELNIGAEDGRRVKGIVTTDHQRIVLAKNQFQGTASTIEYGVDTSGLKAGDEICGNITVSSNLEERCVRVHVSIAGKTMNISGQEIHSLADFVHLASHDFGAAYRFFVKKEFARLLQKEAPEQMALYQGLSHKPVTFQHLEEFLVALGQKEPVMLSAEQPEKTVLTVDQPRKETLYLYKNTWGYVRMEIEVQGDFLEVEKKVVTSEDFIGSVYGVEYIIHQEKIGNGRHYGRITVRQGKQELRFELEVTNSEKALQMHEQWNGKLETAAKAHVNSREDLAIAYTPGVAEPCKVIAKDPEAAYKYTIKSNTVAVVSDGSAVLGLGNIGALAAMPVMEGKAVLFKEFGGVNAVPVCLDTQDTEENYQTVVNIAPAFGGINLEDISAPRCFGDRRTLKKSFWTSLSFMMTSTELPLFVLAGIINALKVPERRKKTAALS